MNAVQKEKFLASEPDTVGLYLNDSQEVPLLTAEEEVTLAKRIEAGRWARETLPNVATNNDRHVQKRIAKLTTVIENGEDALEHLIRANSGLVISVAKRYQGRGVPFSDLIQEGNIGLIRSTKKFDYRKGNKFSTYATWWIRQAVSRAIADQARTIRVPVHLGGQIKRVYKTQLQLQQMLDRDPTIEEIADYLHKNPAKVERLLEISRRPISLSQTHDMGDGDSDEFGEFIEDTNVAMPEEETDKNILKAQLIEILDHLPPRERRVLELRYGLIDGQAMTLGAVGLKMGVTRERVRQIEAKALKRLQYSSIKRQLT
jgi:RNA polymerase primary sigma factor